jgi:hypothetical protein
MRGLILRVRKPILIACAMAMCASFVSCATKKKDVVLVKDPDDQKEGSIPWNKQEKWETSGAMGAATDRR